MTSKESRRSSKFDSQKTISQLENRNWGKAPSEASNLQRTCFELRQKPLKEFSVEDLRIMIGQDIALPYLLPRAFEILEQDPFCKGMHYQGDLLCNVLRADPAFYNENTELKMRAQNLLSIARAAIKHLDENDAKHLVQVLGEATKFFEHDNWKAV